MTATGHRNVASLASYASEPDTSECTTMSNALAKYGSRQEEKNEETSALVPVSDNNAPIPTTSALSQISVSNNNLEQISKSVFAGAIFQGPVTINVNICDNSSK